MAISSTTNKVIYTGDGSTEIYDYSFKIFSSSDLEVRVRLISTGIETLLDLGTDYTVTGVGEVNGGTIVLVDADQAWLDASGFLLSTYKIVIKRKRNLTQQTSIKNQNDYYPEIHENQFDKEVMQDQDLQEQLDRSIKVPVSISSGDFNPEIPASYLDADSAILTLNETGTAFATTPVTLDNLAALVSIADGTFTSSRAIVSDVNGLPTSSVTTASEIVHLSGVNSQLSGNTQTATLQNKTLDNSNSLTARDDRFILQDNADTTKQAAFQLSGISTATTRTYTLPNASTTLVGTDVVQTLTNKTHSFGIVSDTESFDDQGSDVSTPSAGYKNLYAKSAGMFYRDSSGNVFQLQTAATTPVTVQRFLSGSGTYTTPAGVRWINVKVIGGGGGGGGSCTAAANDGGTGSAGVASSFGTSLLTANGGAGGSGGNGGSGGAGGSVTINAPAITVIGLSGGSGGAAISVNTAGFSFVGGMGASTHFGGAGGSGALSTAGNSAASNSGSGGGGGGSPSAGTGGCGGGAGGMIEAIITSPSASYAYVCGSGGGAGTAGTGGFAGGAGGSGVVIVTEYY